MKTSDEKETNFEDMDLEWPSGPLDQQVEPTGRKRSLSSSSSADDVDLLNRQPIPLKSEVGRPIKTQEPSPAVPIVTSRPSAKVPKGVPKLNIPQVDSYDDKPLESPKSGKRAPVKRAPIDVVEKPAVAKVEPVAVMPPAASVISFQGLSAEENREREERIRLTRPLVFRKLPPPAPEIDERGPKTIQDAYAARASKKARQAAEKAERAWQEAANTDNFERIWQVKRAPAVQQPDVTVASVAAAASPSQIPHPEAPPEVIPHDAKEKENPSPPLPAETQVPVYPDAGKGDDKRGKLGPIPPDDGADGGRTPKSILPLEGHKRREVPPINDSKPSNLMLYMPLVKIADELVLKYLARTSLAEFVKAGMAIPSLIPNPVMFALIAAEILGKLKGGNAFGSGGSGGQGGGSGGGSGGGQGTGQGTGKDQGGSSPSGQSGQGNGDIEAARNHLIDVARRGLSGKTPTESDIRFEQGNVGVALEKGQIRLSTGNRANDEAIARQFAEAVKQAQSAKRARKVTKPAPADSSTSGALSSTSGALKPVPVVQAEPAPPARPAPTAAPVAAPVLAEPPPPAPKTAVAPKIWKLSEAPDGVLEGYISKRDKEGASPDERKKVEDAKQELNRRKEKRTEEARERAKSLSVEGMGNQDLESIVSAAGKEAKKKKQDPLVIEKGKIASEELGRRSKVEAKREAKRKKAERARQSASKSKPSERSVGVQQELMAARSTMAIETMANKPKPLPPVAPQPTTPPAPPLAKDKPRPAKLPLQKGKFYTVGFASSNLRKTQTKVEPPNVKGVTLRDINRREYEARQSAAIEAKWKLTDSDNEWDSMDIDSYSSDEWKLKPTPAPASKPVVQAPLPTFIEGNWDRQAIERARLDREKAAARPAFAAAPKAQSSGTVWESKRLSSAQGLSSGQTLDLLGQPPPSRAAERSVKAKPAPVDSSTSGALKPAPAVPATVAAPKVKSFQPPLLTREAASELARRRDQGIFSGKSAKPPLLKKSEDSVVKKTPNVPRELLTKEQQRLAAEGKLIVSAGGGGGGREPPGGGGGGDGTMRRVSIFPLIQAIPKMANPMDRSGLKWNDRYSREKAIFDRTKEQPPYGTGEDAQNGASRFKKQFGSYIYQVKIKDRWIDVHKTDKGLVFDHRTGGGGGDGSSGGWGIAALAILSFGLF
jgi:hypothetical protein